MSKVKQALSSDPTFQIFQFFLSCLLFYTELGQFLSHMKNKHTDSNDVIFWRCLPPHVDRRFKCLLVSMVSLTTGSLSVKSRLK